MQYICCIYIHKYWRKTRIAKIEIHMNACLCRFDVVTWQYAATSWLECEFESKDWQQWVWTLVHLTATCVYTLPAPRPALLLNRAVFQCFGSQQWSSCSWFKYDFVTEIPPPLSSFLTATLPCFYFLVVLTGASLLPYISLCHKHVENNHWTSLCLLFKNLFYGLFLDNHETFIELYIHYCLRGHHVIVFV